MKFLKQIIACLVIIIFTAGCSSAKPAVLTGKTMGTTWRVVIAEKRIPDDLRMKIEIRLNEINESMSMFRKRSELSKFNALKKGEGPICVSDDFMTVYSVGQSLFRLTGGAWDGTAGPLVNLWGFGKDRPGGSLPEDAVVSEKLRHVGYDKILLSGKNCLSKKDFELILDFGSVAKGYGVDVISELLGKNGMGNFLVEVGGEVYAEGTRFGKKWTIGISMPERALIKGRIFNTVNLKGRAIATSGDYRNFREIEGRVYSHIINPSTGWPVKNSVASVSVIADTTVFADGLATALMVMGVESGIRLTKSLEGVDCMMIIRNPDGTFSPFLTEGFSDIVKERS